MKKPLVSIIITTKNEEKNIANCLESIKDQTYSNIEAIVIDNNSTDNTKKIAKKYTTLVFTKGPERSAQRNFGAQKAKGEYILFVDCDMMLTEKVIEQCVSKIEQGYGGLIIPEQSFGLGFWANAKSLERSFYLGNKNIEAARFFPKNIFLEKGGFDENLTGPEDWDLSQRIGDDHKIGRIPAFIKHNEGQLSLTKTIQKKYYYSKKFGPYIMKDVNKKSSSQQFSLIGRYSIFFAQPKKLMKDPVLSLGMLFMKTSEFVAGGFGLISSKITKNS